MTYYADIVLCSDGSYYTDHTDDLDSRIALHNSGLLPGYTHSRRPVLLMWTQEFSTREEALAAEIQIKKWTRAKKQALIDGDWVRLSQLAQNRQDREI